MLTLVVPGPEHFDESTGVFSTLGDVTLELEHSLVSLSKWESEFCKPFLGLTEKTTEETLSYIRAMTLTPDFPPEVFSRLSPKNYDQIADYINAKMTATWFNEIGSPSARNSETITSELIYYWLVVFNIPFDVETWHLNRVFALIKICNIKNSKPKKMSRSEVIARNRELNAQRKAQLNTTG